MGKERESLVRREGEREERGDWVGGCVRGGEGKSDWVANPWPAYADVP